MSNDSDRKGNSGYNHYDSVLQLVAEENTHPGQESMHQIDLRDQEMLQRMQPFYDIVLRIGNQSN